MSFFVFHIEAELICIGERIKKGNYRPCVTTIPQSTITGALKDYTGLAALHAVGYWESFSDKEAPGLSTKLINCSPRYVDIDNPRLPLFIEYLERPRGKIYIEKNSDVPEPNTVLSKLVKGSFTMGALKSKGFGRCRINYLSETPQTDMQVVTGFLRTRLYADPDNLRRFSIQQIEKPYWGYLFRPRSLDDGDYIKSLFEGSEVTGYRFLVNERREHERR